MTPPAPTDTDRALLAYALRTREEANAWAERLKGIKPIAADRCLLVAEVMGRVFADEGRRAGEGT